MTDITRESIRAWRDAALLQIAAESYFQDSNLLDPDELRQRLERGNTPLDNNEADQQQYVRMAGTGRSVSQALDFIDHYEIVDQHANDCDAPPCLRDRVSWNHLAPSSDLSTQVAS